MPQDDTSISRSSTAAAHSVSSSINPDGKEYESYGEWDAYLSQFIKTYFPQVIQDDLYMTPQQVFAVTLIDDSGDVDKEKKSFRVPDASLRFRKAEQLHFDAFKARYLNDNPDSQVELLEAVQSLISWDLADGWIPSVQMDSLLVFVEIKPGASWKRLKFNYRMFDDCMETWIWEFYQHLDQACEQAREQAQYFFKNNSDRDSVVAFATAGFKWCWRVFERSEIGDGGPFVDNTFGAPSSDPSFGSSPAPAEPQEKSGKRRPRVSTDSQPSHPDNTRPAPKCTKIS
ncbi:hypothetical protein EWM64_g1859 [Hericium alpestre]|uniref:Uncharacterized protein n=1 Tax=Hericium alpestre TaxID=135208 RepID=A0A4Z0A7A6_9AGAM|nr:hypothetical protein EWM64_g1859 [Hericium alpestre]